MSSPKLPKQRKSMTRIEAIDAYCIDCANGRTYCGAVLCALYPFRNPLLRDKANDWPANRISEPRFAHKRGPC